MVLLKNTRRNSRQNIFPSNKRSLCQLDVKNAFIHDNLSETIYIKPGLLARWFEYRFGLNSDRVILPDPFYCVRMYNMLYASHDLVSPDA